MAFTHRPTEKMHFWLLLCWIPCNQNFIFLHLVPNDMQQFYSYIFFYQFLYQQTQLIQYIGFIHQADHQVFAS
jgi:hypothetical protein